MNTGIPTQTPASPRRLAPAWVAVLALLLVISPGCLSPEEAVAEVDEEAYEIIGEKQITVKGKTYAFVVDPPKDRYANRVIDPETGLARESETLVISVGDALDLAALNSREFQNEKETLYRAALSLMREREDFRNSPFALFDGGATKSGETESIDAGGNLGVTRMLERGGDYVLSMGLDFLRIVSSPTSENLTSFLNLTISLPFLRNAGREIALENLTQADRNVLYGMRDFERFKQTFSVRVISTYLRLLSQKRRIENEVANLKSLELARKRAEELFKEQRSDIVEVGRARQSELSSQDRLVTSRQALEASLDAFKDLLGLPVDMKIDVRMEDLEIVETLTPLTAPWDARDMMLLGLRTRLDVRNTVDSVEDAARRVVVAENALKPSLSLDLSARATSDNLKPLKYDFDDGVYSAGLDFDPGLDLDLESISLRQALLDLQRSYRTQESFVNQVKLEVQAALRQVRENLEIYRISQTAVKLAESRVESSRMFLEEGRKEIIDFLDSQESLINNQNTMVRNLVEYRIAYLNLLSDTGVLVVSPEGLDHDASKTLLEQK